MKYRIVKKINRLNQEYYYPQIFMNDQWIPIKVNIGYGYMADSCCSNYIHAIKVIKHEKEKQLAKETIETMIVYEE